MDTYSLPKFGPVESHSDPGFSAFLVALSDEQISARIALRFQCSCGAGIVAASPSALRDQAREHAGECAVRR